jgi:putative acetyltransferase
MANLTIRAEQPSDVKAIYDVEEQAFGRPLEAGMVDALRDHGKVVLSLVAEHDGEIVGHVLFSWTTIETGSGSVREASLGPIGVLPRLQGRGIGGAMIREGLSRCRDLGFGAVFLLGNPAYYGRFGFRPARLLGITYYQGIPYEDAFQVVELREGALEGVKGVAREEPELG